jgi:hypothetical protein
MLRGRSMISVHNNRNLLRSRKRLIDNVSSKLNTPRIPKQDVKRSPLQSRDSKDNPIIIINKRHSSKNLILILLIFSLLLVLKYIF